MVVRLWKGFILYYGMSFVVLVSGAWDIDWIPASQWDDDCISIGSPGTGRELLWLRLGDGKNGKEL